MKLSRATIALYVGLVFLCGGVLGFFANRLYTAATVNATANAKKSPQDQEARKSLVGMFQTRLKLTDDQVQKLNLILDESQAQVTAIHNQMDPQIDAVRQNQITRMKLMLAPEQEAEYEKMLQELHDRQQRQKQERRNGGRPNGGPGF
jgi:hypothetical protein